MLKTVTKPSYSYDDLRSTGLSDEILTKSEAIGNQWFTHLSMKKYVPSYFVEVFHL
jgi:hypothetical protein